MHVGRQPRQPTLKNSEQKDLERRQTFMHHMCHCMICQQSIARIVLTDPSTLAGDIFATVIGHAATMKARGFK